MGFFFGGHHGQLQHMTGAAGDVLKLEILNMLDPMSRQNVRMKTYDGSNKRTMQAGHRLYFRHCVKTKYCVPQNYILQHMTGATSDQSELEIFYMFDTAPRQITIKYMMRITSSSQSRTCPTMRFAQLYYIQAYDGSKNVCANTPGCICPNLFDDRQDATSETVFWGTIKKYNKAIILEPNVWGR